MITVNISKRGSPSIQGAATVFKAGISPSDKLINAGFDLNVVRGYDVSDHVLNLDCEATSRDA